MFGNIQTFTFGFFTHPKPDHNIHELEGDKGYGAGPDQAKRDAPELANELGGHTVFGDPVSNVIPNACAAQCRACNHGSTQSTDYPANTVNAEGIQRIVVTQHAFKAGNGSETRRTGD